MPDKYAALYDAPPEQQQSKYAALHEESAPDQPVPIPTPTESLGVKIGKVLGRAQDLGKEALSNILPPEIMTPLFGGTGSSIRQEEKFGPIVSPEHAAEFVGQLPEWAGGGTEFAKGMAGATSEAVSGLSNPATLAQIPAFAVPGVAETFAANQIAELPKQGTKLADVLSEHGLFSKESGQALTEAGIQDAMALLAGKEGTAGRFARAESALQPESAISSIPPEIQPFVKQGEEIVQPTAAVPEALPAVPESPAPAPVAPVLSESNMDAFAKELGVVGAGKYEGVPLITVRDPEHNGNITLPVGTTMEEATAIKENKAAQFKAKTPEELRPLQEQEVALLDQVQNRISGETKQAADVAGVKPTEELTPSEAAQPEATRDGIVPPQRITEGSTNPEQAGLVSAQALGVTHPLPGFLRSITDYFVNNTPSQIWNSIRGSLGSTLGKTFAKTTIADRASGELAARWISARAAAPQVAQTFASNILGDSGIDPVKFGAALTEDNLRSIRKAAGTPEDAANVATIVGAQKSPFKTEADYQAFLNDPAVQQALDRHRSLWQETVDPMFRKAQGLEPDEPLPTRGDQTNARINLYNDLEGQGKDIVSGTATGNLSGTLRRKSPFAIRARGTGQSYNINYNDMMTNSFGRQMEIAAKNEFESKLVESGNAKIGKPEKNVVLDDGEATVAFPLKRTVLVDTAEGTKVPVNQNIYVRKSLAGEYRRGANVDLLKVPAVLRAFNSVVNRSALAGLTDASVHVLNQATALLTRPSVVGGALTDSLLSTFGRADVPFTVVKFITKALQDNKAQMAELAEIGAGHAEFTSGNPLARLIQWTDKTTRLVLDDAYKSMVENKLVEDTETNRREFVNQVGQYNKRAQGDLRRLARDSGFGPFVTAGTTFNTLGLRTMTGSPGIPATSTMAAAALRANVMAKWVGAFVLTGTLNYLLTKDKGGGVLGRPGVPIGKIDTGLNDENDRPLSLPVFDILGLGRALRVTGARGLIESQRKGLTLQNSFDAAATDAWNTNISPFAGPVIRFAGVASSGKQLPAINVPRTSKVVPPGESQTAENLKQAILDANPIIKSISLAGEPGQGISAAVRQQIPRLSLQPSQSADFMANYPEIVRKAQAREYINDVIGRARKMKPVDQETFVQEALTKLQDEDRKQAIRTLKYSHISTGL